MSLKSRSEITLASRTLPPSRVALDELRRRRRAIQTKQCGGPDDDGSRAVLGHRSTLEIDVGVQVDTPAIDNRRLAENPRTYALSIPIQFPFAACNNSTVVTILTPGTAELEGVSADGEQAASR